MQILTLIRGLPGSGKSTLARAIQQSTAAAHWEADMYFLRPDGGWTFDPSKLKEAHEWCQSRVREDLAHGYRVVVSNTFTRHWEMAAYKDMAKALGVPVQVIVCAADFPSIHAVPAETIAKMAERWEA